MDLVVSQKPKNGFFGGPKKVQLVFLHDGFEHKITIEQGGIRQITISSTAPMINLLHMFYSLSTLLMLLDGQFYPIEEALENGKNVTHSFRERALASFESADFMVGPNNKLIHFEDVLSADLLEKWIALRTQLDMIHNMMLYCVSAVKMPVDTKCAFLTEVFLGLSELVNESNKAFVLPSAKKGESKLQKYLTKIIERYGQDVFFEECRYNKEQFTQVLTNSRNRIAHIKTKQEKYYLNAEECVLYLMKLSLLYRIIIFDLLEIPVGCYKEKLHSITDSLNKWNGIMQNFLTKMTSERTE